MCTKYWLTGGLSLPRKSSPSRFRCLPWTYATTTTTKAFHWSQSIGSTRMTPVSFVKTTETYVKTTESYEVCIWIVHLLKMTQTGLITASDQTVRAVHSCNLFVVIFQTVRLRPCKYKLISSTNRIISIAN